MFSFHCSSKIRGEKWFVLPSCSFSLPLLAPCLLGFLFSSPAAQRLFCPCGFAFCGFTILICSLQLSPLLPRFACELQQTVIDKSQRTLGAGIFGFSPCCAYMWKSKKTRMGERIMLMFILFPPLSCLNDDTYCAYRCLKHNTIRIDSSSVLKLNK